MDEDPNKKDKGKRLASEAEPSPEKDPKKPLARYNIVVTCNTRMDPNKKPEEAAATSEMDKGKMAASSEEEPAPTLDMDISSSEEESSEEEPAPRHSDLVTDAEIEARLIAEAVYKEHVAELAAIRNLVEESQIGLKVLREWRDKTSREIVKLNGPRRKDDQDGDDKDKKKKINRFVCISQKPEGK